MVEIKKDISALALMLDVNKSKPDINLKEAIS